MSSSGDETMDLGVLDAYVTQTLPTLSAAGQAEVLDNFLRLGVETPSDLAYVEESDFDLKNVKKIQIRKLLKDGTKGHSEKPAAVSQVVTCVSPMSSQPSPCSSLSDSSSDGCSSVSSYTIPWKKMPQRLMNSVRQKERPLPADRREMIRILTDDLTRVYTRPSRKILLTVASKVVTQYPASFEDKMDGIIIGSGHGSLLTQLEQRVQNLSRSGKNSAKRSLEDQDSASTEGKKNSTNRYGTCRSEFEPGLPEEETESMQGEKKKTLKEMYSLEIWEKDKIKEMMDSTYPSVRKDINTGKETLNNIKANWPFLFEEFIMLPHVNRLLGLDLRDNIMHSLLVRFPRLLHYLHTKSCKSLKMKLHELDTAKRQEGNNSPEAVGCLMLLCSFFGEDITTLVQDTEDTSLVTDVQTGKLPITPCLVSVGSPLKTSDFMLAVDQVIVNDHINSPINAVCLLFSSFYVFNIEYPDKAAATLEFLQRCFAGVNPPTGSRARKCPRGNINPKVLSLINNLTDFESQWKA